MNQPEKKIDVSIVIVSYNTRDWLDRCLSSIPPAAVSQSVEIIVVDNASKDGSADAVEALCPQARVFRNTVNTGFARAVNQGASYARGEFVMLLNPDGFLEPGAIEKLVSFARSNPQYVICGGRTITPAGELDPRSCWAAPSLWSLACNAVLLSTLRPGSRLFDPEAMGDFHRDHARRVDIVTGCLLLISLADWRSLQGFDERYFVYGEDADLCLRAASKTGRGCAITPEAVMIHAVGASSASRPDKLELLLKGRIALARVHLGGWQRRAGAALIVWGVWLRAMLERAGVSRGTNWAEVWRRRDRWRAGYLPAQATVKAGH
jgi:N-acetylglucosaminyl-diphospho-decaprenol L-rhamnosyltransferase